MRDLFRGLCLLGAFVCFFLTFSFKVTSGRTYSKVEVGLVGPWWIREVRAGRIANTLTTSSGSALCGFSIPVLAVARALTRRRNPRPSVCTADGDESGLRNLPCGRALAPPMSSSAT